ncbi:hypothetical protein [Paractinoplanes abujensis]|uniref:Uncharacterized protein n=1 Tax=Paractinoplanes abujensis TaxID=882441 RepID=A0A7W7CTV6_9ACTN|nr:hypothetical protein [Actinoplanes abujensis]MBB4693183.1 hypothetical protein [Actinoplanes abujensis]
MTTTSRTAHELLTRAGCDGFARRAAGELPAAGRLFISKRTMDALLRNIF